MFSPPTLQLQLHNYEIREREKKKKKYGEEANQSISVQKKTYKYQENTPGKVSFTFITITKYQHTGSSFIMWSKWDNWSSLQNLSIS